MLGIKALERVVFKPEFSSPREENVTYIAVQNEYEGHDGTGRVTVEGLVNSAICPQQLVRTETIEEHYPIYVLETGALAKDRAESAANNRKTAKQFRLELAANVDAYWAHKIDYEAFHERQREIWDAISARGNRMQDLVCKLLRSDLPSAVNPEAP